MQIRQWKRHFSACQHWFFDSAYPNTPNCDIKPFSSQNACTFMKKLVFAWRGWGWGWGAGYAGIFLTSSDAVILWWFSIIIVDHLLEKSCSPGFPFVCYYLVPSFLFCAPFPFGVLSRYVIRLYLILIIAGDHCIFIYCFCHVSCRQWIDIHLIFSACLLFFLSVGYVGAGFPWFR